MKKLLFAIAACALTASAAMAATTLSYDDNGTKIQGFAPDPSLTTRCVLTKGDCEFTTTGRVGFKIHANADVKMYFNNKSGSYWPITANAPETYIIPRYGMSKAIFSVTSSATATTVTILGQ